MNYLTFKTYWGRYIIFSLVAFIFSLANFMADDPEYPNSSTRWFFFYFGSHLAYWAMYSIFTLQFILVARSMLRSSAYPFIVSFIFGAGGVLSFVIAIINSFVTQSILPLSICSIGMAIILAAYHLNLQWKELSSTMKE